LETARPPPRFQAAPPKTPRDTLRRPRQ
jgi:hypothetical protein